MWCGTAAGEEEGMLAERLQDHCSPDLPGRRMPGGHLQVVLGLGGQRAGRALAVHPFGGGEKPAGFRELVGGEDLGNVEDHGGVWFRTSGCR